jgi:hypothetical protein
VSTICDLESCFKRSHDTSNSYTQYKILWILIVKCPSCLITSTLPNKKWNTCDRLVDYLFRRPLANVLNDILGYLLRSHLTFHDFKGCSRKYQFQKPRNNLNPQYKLQIIVRGYLYSDSTSAILSASSMREYGGLAYHGTTVRQLIFG